MQKKILVFILLASLGLRAATAQENHLFTMELKPVRGEGGAVTMVHVEQTVSGIASTDGKLLSVRAAITDVGTQHIADRIANLKISDGAGDVPLTIETMLLSQGVSATSVTGVRAVRWLFLC